MRSTQFEVNRSLSDEAMVTLHASRLGEGPPLVLLHGLTATRRNVVQGSSALARAGYELISFDARGHGSSTPTPSYRYSEMVEDLLAIVDQLEIEQMALIGASMGAATALAFTLAHPERVQTLVQITPAYGAGPNLEKATKFDKLAEILEEGGPQAFALAALPGRIPPQWKETVLKGIEQRVERHKYPTAVAKALREVPRSYAWHGWSGLEELDLPVLVVGSRDELDPLHPLAIAREYVRRLRHAELRIEPEGKAPLAWQGARLSRGIAEHLARSGYDSA